MKKLFTLLMFFCLVQIIHSQSYTKWISGDSSDFVTENYKPGLVLAGGGGDNNDAMRWMLERAGGGDVLVLRASGSNGYNDYFFTELGVSVNSVETIRFNDAAAATDPYIIQQIQNAEVLFLAGGDQYNYYQYWKDNPIEDAINFLLNEKKITVGGTSAGMAVLGEAYYTPPGSSALTDEVIADPFHPNIDILGKGDFLHHNLLINLVTDTHYDQRNRSGRHVVFMARLAAEYGVRIYGIACNEYTAACIDENGVAAVFGEYPSFDDFAYFLQVNCQDEFLPETLQPGMPLTWKRNQAAVKACRVPGLQDGGNTFDLNDWQSTVGGVWFDWFVENGTFVKNADADPQCDAFATGVKKTTGAAVPFKISPNPAGNILFVEMPDGKNALLKISSLMGQTLLQNRITRDRESINIEAFAPGFYFLTLETEGRFFTEKLIISR